MRQATFPVTKTLEEFDVAASSIPPATFDYLSSLEWIRATENVCMIGPAGTGQGVDEFADAGVGQAAVGGFDEPRRR